MSVRVVPRVTVRATQQQLIEEARDLLVDVMAREGISRAEMARRTGRTKSHMTRILSAEHNVTLRTAAEMFYAAGYRLELRARRLT